MSDTPRESRVPTAKEAKAAFEARMSEVPDMIITAPDGTVVDTGKEKDARISERDSRTT